MKDQVSQKSETLGSDRAALCSSGDSPGVIAQPEVAPNDMLQQPDRSSLLDAADHVGQDGSNGIESFVCLTDVGKANVIKQDLLYNEDGDGLAELRTSLHDAQTEWNDLRGQEKGDDLRVIRLLDESSNDAERSQSEVLKWSGLGRCIEERV